MPTVESLVFEASVIEDFEDTLTDLAAGLAEIDRLAAETVEDIEAEVKHGDAMEDLAELEAATEAVDDDIRIGADGDNDDFFSEFDPVEQSALEDFIGPYQFQKRDQPDGGDGDGAPVTSGGFTLLEDDTIRRVKDAFGDAFDDDALVDSAGEITEATDVLDGTLSDFVDSEALTDRLLDDDSDLSLTDLIPDGESELPGLDVIESLPDDLAELPEVSDGLFDRFKNLELKMGDFFKIFATILPLLSIFIGALPAAIAGLVSLAGAAIAAATTLGALGALAVFGMGREDGEFSLENFQDEFDELAEAFSDTFGPLADDIAGRINGVDALVSGIENLGTQLSFLTRLTDEARGALNYLSESVPEVVGEFTRFGAAAIPVLGVLDRLFAELDLIDAFARTVKQTLPTLITLIVLLADLVGPIIDLSMGFVAASIGLIGFLRGILQVLDAVPLLLEVLGFGISVLLGLITVSAAYTVIGETMVGTILAQAAAWIGKFVPAAISAKIAQLGLTASTVALYTALAALFGLLTFGIVPAISTLSTGFSDLGNSIDEATSSLQQFNSVNGAMSGVTLNGVDSRNGGGGNPYAPQGGNTTVIAPDQETGNAVANTVSFKQGTLNSSEDQRNVDSRRDNGSG